MARQKPFILFKRETNKIKKKSVWIINTDGNVEGKLYFKNISGILLFKFFIMLANLQILHAGIILLKMMK